MENNKYWNVVKSYFTESEWEKLDDNHKEVAVMVYDNYRTLLEAGFPSEPPSFVKKYESRPGNSREVFQSTSVELQPEDALKQKSEAIENRVDGESEEMYCSDSDFDYFKYWEELHGDDIHRELKKRLEELKKAQAGQPLGDVRNVYIDSVDENHPWTRSM